MSKGHGKIENAILDCLQQCEHANAYNLVNFIRYRATRENTRALKSSVNRAIRNLHKNGLIVEYIFKQTIFEHEEGAKTTKTKYWTTPERIKKKEGRERKEAKAEAREERKRAEAKAARRAERKRPPKELLQLPKILGMLGSNHEGERNAAAHKVEAIRRKLDLGWEEIFERYLTGNPLASFFDPHIL